MEKQVLLIEQMRELIDMGVDVSKTSCCWCKVKAANKEGFDWMLLPEHLNKCDEEHIPTFTLQDILEITINTVPQLWKKDGIPTWHIHNYMMKGHFIGTNLMDIAFKYIKWCKQNNYI